MIERILCYLSFFILIFVITKTIMNMATKTLHRAEIIVDENIVTVYIVSALGHYDDK